MAKSIGLREVENFIRRDLKRKLADDLLNTNMLREADLQGCAYVHLRHFLKGDERWRVFGCRDVPKIRAFLDLLISYDGLPQIARELKWKRLRISRKDRRSLHRALKELRLKKVYFLTTADKKSSYTKLGSQKSPAEKYRLQECVVVPNCSSDDLLRLKKDRRSYKIAA